MQHKYIRYEVYGFVVWPVAMPITHKEMASHIKDDKILSAGFVEFVVSLDETRVPICHGHSESLAIPCRMDDSMALNKQLFY